MNTPIKYRYYQTEDKQSIYVCNFNYSPCDSEVIRATRQELIDQFGQFKSEFKEKMLAIEVARDDLKAALGNLYTGTGRRYA